VGGQVWDPEGSTATWDMKLGRSIDAQEEDISTKNGIDWRRSDDPPPPSPSQSWGLVSVVFP